MLSLFSFPFHLLRFCSFELCVLKARTVLLNQFPLKVKHLVTNYFPAVIQLATGEPGVSLSVGTEENETFELSLKSPRSLSPTPLEERYYSLRISPCFYIC